MATSHNIEVEPREAGGKGASRRLRHAGKVPAIVYGGDLEPRAIQIHHNTVFLMSQHEWFYSAILDLSLDGDVQPVLLRDMQRHPFKPQILHLDFQRVNLDQEIRVRVPLHFLNEDKSPAGKASSVVVSHAITDVEISCLPRNLPEYIEVDLGEMEIGDIVHLSDLKLPEGIEIPELNLGKEHDHAVVTAREVEEEIEESPDGEQPDVAPAAPEPKAK